MRAKLTTTEAQATGTRSMIAGLVPLGIAFGWITASLERHPLNSTTGRTPIEPSPTTLSDAEYADHVRTYRGFVRGTALFAALALLILLLLYYLFG
jgi:hypothetical protein